MTKNKNIETNHSVDFSNYNPYYTDISEYIKVCNKARFIFVSNRDLEAYATALTVLVNTTSQYLKSKIKIKSNDPKIKEENKTIVEALDLVNAFMPLYKAARKKINNKELKIPKTIKVIFFQREQDNLIILDDIQRAVLQDLSKQKILPRSSKEWVEDDDGLPFN